MRAGCGDAQAAEALHGSSRLFRWHLFWQALIWSGACRGGRAQAALFAAQLSLQPLLRPAALRAGSFSWDPEPQIPERPPPGQACSPTPQAVPCAEMQAAGRQLGGRQAPRLSMLLRALGPAACASESWSAQVGRHAWHAAALAGALRSSKACCTGSHPAGRQLSGGRLGQASRGAGHRAAPAGARGGPAAPARLCLPGGRAACGGGAAQRRGAHACANTRSSARCSPCTRLHPDMHCAAALAVPQQRGTRQPGVPPTAPAVDPISQDELDWLVGFVQDHRQGVPLKQVASIAWQAEQSHDLQEDCSPDRGGLQHREQHPRLQGPRGGVQLGLQAHDAPAGARAGWSS